MSVEMWNCHFWQCWLGCPSAFESKWHHWTEKRSLCALAVLKGGVHLPLVSVSLYMHWYFLIFSYWTVKRFLCSMTVLTGGSICLWVSMTPMNSEEITLFSGSVDQGGPSAFGVCIFIYALVFPDIFLLNSEEINLFYDSVDCRGSICRWCLYLYICTGISLYFLIEQWRDHSVLWQCWPGGVHLPLSLNDTNEQWRDHSVLWQCWLGGSICLWVSMTPMNSEEITLFSGSVDQGGPSAFNIYMFSLCTGISLYFLISWLFWMGSHWQHWKA